MLLRMSMRPKAFRVASTMASTSALTVTSHLQKAVLTPNCAAISAAGFLRGRPHPCRPPSRWHQPGQEHRARTAHSAAARPVTTRFYRQRNFNTHNCNFLSESSALPWGGATCRCMYDSTCRSGTPCHFRQHVFQIRNKMQKDHCPDRAGSWRRYSSGLIPVAFLKAL